MRIDGLDKKPEPTMEELGVFKLKDREGRNVVSIDFAKVNKPITELERLHIFKIRGSNNKIRVVAQWKAKVKEIVVGDKKVTQVENKDGLSQLTEKK